MQQIDLTTQPDRDVFILAFMEDDAPYVAGDEIERRFGADANDQLASYFTASHASREDMVRMATDETDLLVEIAKGEHQCPAADTQRSERCRCGAILQ